MEDNLSTDQSSGEGFEMIQVDYFFQILIRILLNFIFNWRIITSQCCVVSAERQQESATDIHMSLPLKPPSNPSRLSKSAGFKFPPLHSTSVYFLSNLMLLLMSQEVQVRGLEVGDACCKEKNYLRVHSVSGGNLHPLRQLLDGECPCPGWPSSWLSVIFHH